MAAPESTRDTIALGTLQRKSSSGTNRSFAHREGNNDGKQSDLYFTELLSYSLDRLRKVMCGGCGKVG
jgi:hypothetical protein